MDINKEDIIIKPCTSCGNIVKPIDMDRINIRLDDFYAKKEFDEAERLINYWIGEAKNGNNLRGELELQNEYMGFCRKQGRKDDAISHAKRADEIINETKLDNTVSGATIFINIATVYKAFGNPEVAITYFDKAKKVYDENLKSDDRKFAGLYNNMALALVDLKKYDEAETMYKKAIDIQNSLDDGELDAAISYLNYADLIYARYQDNKDIDFYKYENAIKENVEKAWTLFNLDRTKHDGYYRFVCEKSAHSFGFYGYFMYEKELNKRAAI